MGSVGGQLLPIARGVGVFERRRRYGPLPAIVSSAKREAGLETNSLSTSGRNLVVHSSIPKTRSERRIFPDCESPTNHSMRFADAIYMRYPQGNH